MNETVGSCEVGAARGAGGAGAPASRVLRFRPDFRWEGVPVQSYKAPADHWCGIIRSVLVGEGGERTAFHVRYFEIAPGGFSSLEHHRHEHVVVVLRGCGEVRLGETTHAVGFGDVVYVAPDEVHQLRNPSGAEPFGFLCVVDARRDAPVPVPPPTG
ncbi:MAG TPA: cupin domain-containing protein [Gemmataceae bacterium]|nr:cupin domain-containing protein [Gemmataceae bacterium]